MNQSGQAEFRIFTGLHAGARAILPPGRYLVGSDASCDLIVCDEGVAEQHAELRIEEADWLFRPLQPGKGIPNDGLKLAPGIGVALGPVVVALDAANAPWREPALETEPEKPTEPPAEEAPAEMPEVPVGAAEPAEPTVPVAANESKPQKKSKAGWHAMLLVLAIAAGILTTTVLHEEAAPPSKPRGPSAALIAEREARIAAVLKDLGFTERTQLSRLGDGNLLVTATLIDDDEHEQLAAALAQLNPRPGLKVFSEKELVQSVLDAVAAREEGLKAHYLGSGRFRIQGKVASDEERDALLKALAAEFPSVREFENALLTPLLMAEQLLERLRKSGLPEATGQWTDGVFVIASKKPAADLAAVTQAMTQADADFGRWLRFSVQVEKAPALATPREYRLPFKLVGVVGGTTPYVVLQGGTKVLVGGQVDNWRLVGVDDTQVIFDGPQRVALRR